MIKTKVFIILLQIFLPMLMLMQSMKAFDLKMLNGDTLYAWAEGGLNVRSSDNRSANIVGMIPYGKALIFLQYGSTGNVDQIQFYHSSDEDTIINGKEFKCIDYFQKGLWIQIRYENIIGFVFNGYTSRYKSMEGETSIQRLIRHNSSLISETEKYDEINDCMIKHMYFDQGISVTETLSNVGSMTYVFPNMTLEEAILLTRNRIKSQYQYILPGGDICLNERLGDPKSGIQSLKFTNNTNWSMIITLTGRSVIISENVWC